jgi:hypothetical protein
MKWVADKKLQLDVAVIKALYLLDETSLTDVIETLTGLCNGEVPPPRPARSIAPALSPVVAIPKVATPSPSPAPAFVAPPPVAKPAPVVAEVVTPAQSSDPVTPASVWEKIANELSETSFIRFSWLRDGIFDRVEGMKIFIRFPESSRESVESVFLDDAIKDIESRLLKELSTPYRVALEFDANLQPAAEPIIGEPEEIPIAEPVVEEPVPLPAPPADPMADFMNDPLIEKALEIFKSTLQTK